MPPIQNSIFYNPTRSNEALAGKRSVGSARDKDEEVTMKLDAIADQLKDTVEAIHSNETIQIDKDGKIKVKGMGLDKKYFVDVVGAAEKAHLAKMKELNKKYEKITNKATAYKVLSKLLDDTKKSIVKLVGENIDDLTNSRKRRTPSVFKRNHHRVGLRINLINHTHIPIKHASTLNQNAALVFTHGSSPPMFILSVFRKKP